MCACKTHTRDLNGFLRNKKLLYSQLFLSLPENYVQWSFYILTQSVSAATAQLVEPLHGIRKNGWLSPSRNRPKPLNVKGCPLPVWIFTVLWVYVTLKTDVMCMFCTSKNPLCFMTISAEQRFKAAAVQWHYDASKWVKNDTRTQVL